MHALRIRIAAAMLAAATAAAVAAPATSAAQSPAASATSADAARFMERAERELDELSIKASQAQWVAATYITEDTEAISADATRNYSVAVQRLAMEAKRFDRLALPAELRRKFTLLKLALAAPPPGNPAEAAELTKLTTGMEADYGRGEYCPAPDSPLARQAKGIASEGSAGAASADTARACLQINELSRVLATSG